MTDLTRYAYDWRTQAYVGTTLAHPDPMNPGQVLEPAFTTAIEPPPNSPGQSAAWSGEEWEMRSDHRGETWFKGDAPVVVDFLGDPAAHGLTQDPPPLPEPPPPSSCSKLGLKRAFTEKGLWPTVRAMIASDADMQEDWDLAVELRITDPIVQRAVYGLTLAGIPLSAADVQALVTRANELVA